MFNSYLLDEKVSSKLKVAKPNKSSACCAPFCRDQLQSVCKRNTNTEIVASEPKREMFYLRNLTNKPQLLQHHLLI